MMTIKEIYKRYQIPPNLQRHMREVAQVTWFVADNWIGETLNLDLALNTALLHDLGNLVKFKQPFLGELKSRADHWLAFQSEMITKYGGDAKIATLAMVAELGLAESVGRIRASSATHSCPQKPSNWTTSRVCSGLQPTSPNRSAVARPCA